MKHYPLTALVKLRAGKVDAATRELSTANAAATAAERVRREAEESRVRHEAAALAIRVSERAALDSSLLTAGDFHRADEWQVCINAEQARLAREVLERQRHEASAREIAAESRALLTTRRADARVVEDHRDAWQAGIRKAADERADEEAGEAGRASTAQGT